MDPTLFRVSPKSAKNLKSTVTRIRSSHLVYSGRGKQVAGDDLDRELHYGLGRACEADGKTERALELYHQLLQWDYNYRDTRGRVEKLRGSG